MSVNDNDRLVTGKLRHFDASCFSTSATLVMLIHTIVLMYLIHAHTHTHTPCIPKLNVIRSLNGFVFTV